MTMPLMRPKRKNPVLRTRQMNLPPWARSRVALGLTAVGILGPDTFTWRLLSFAAFPVAVLLTGIGLPDDRLHAPDEKLDLKQLWDGINVFKRFYQLLAEMRA